MGVSTRTDWPIPNDVKVFVDDGLPPDFFLCSPTGWEIWSERAADRIKRFAGDAVHFVDAPLYRFKTRRLIPGYKIIIATKEIPCLEMKQSKYDLDEDDPTRISLIWRWVFDEKKVPKDLHVFRPAEWNVAMFFSRDLMLELMSGEYLEDLSFVQYGGEGDDQGANIRRHRPEGKQSAQSHRR